MYSQFSRYKDASGFDFSIHPLTLAFKKDSLEKEFRTSYFENNLQLGRACHIIAVFFYLLVGLWDAVIFDPTHLFAWQWVLSVVVLVFIGGFVSSFVALDFYSKHWQQIFAGYVLITGIGFTIVTIASGPEYPVHNFVGIIFCLFFCYAFIRLTFLYALAAGNLIVMIYTAGTVLFFDLPGKLVLNEFFYMFGVNFLGMMVCYAMELLSRRDYMLNELLRQAERKTKNVNVRLEQMVADRTRDLHLSNKELARSLAREKELVAKLEKEEKSLQKSLASLETAEVIARLGYFEKNWQTGEHFWSKGFLALLGESPDQVLKTDETFWAHIHEKDRQKISDLVRQSKKDRSSMAAEFRLVRTDGEVLEVRGAADHYFDDGNLMISRGVLQDITVQKQAQEDLARLEDQLIQAQKMESIGRLAGGVAHDYNNISGIIIGYTELAMDQVNSDDPLHQTLEKVISAAQRATDITRQLLAFARKQTIDPKVIELNQAVKNILNILERLIGEDIDLVWNPGQNIWLVKIDPAQVDQILVNLCINSRDAICGSGKITIETRNVSFDHAYCNQHSGFKPGNYSMLAVSDDGTGMTQEILENVFEPFFTTKEIGQGTGLGLSTIYGIVKQNNGFVNAYSEPGEGTSIKVYLKRYKGTLDYAEKSDENENEKVRATGETILIVEDDKDILDLAKTVLTKAGYRVVASNTPVSALSIAREETGRIHLLLTDVVMPEMSGRELADALPKISPGIETLFMSGYTANIIAHRGVLDKGVNFISKPFSGKELTAKVRKILDKDKKDLVIRQS